MDRVALIGSEGQLGSEIARLWPATALAATAQLVPLSHRDIEVCDAAQVSAVLRDLKPRAVINTTAYNRVDDCEADSGPAFEVNAIGVQNLALACRELDALCVHFSTDYVFSGEKGSPYLEDDATGPVNVYGVSKLAGEQVLRVVLPEDHLLLRTAGIYGRKGARAKGGNFVATMLRLASEGRPIRVVNDQTVSTMYAEDLALHSLQLLEGNGRGTFHLVNRGHCSWYDFAREIFRIAGMQANLTAVSAAEFGAAARRPAFSALESSRLDGFGIAPRPWQEALAAHLADSVA